MKNVAAFYASKTGKAGLRHAARTCWRWARGSTAAASPIGRSPACAGCHSPNGAGIPAQYPRLSGQHVEYSAAQLIAFRAGLRMNSLQMTGVAAKMNDQEIKAVADYIAGLR